MVTGLSGAGRSTAAKCLEDLGWFVVDNLPPELVATMVELGAQARGAITRVAVVMDVRSRAFTDDLAAVIKDLDARGYKPRTLFLEATDDVLIRRAVLGSLGRRGASGEPDVRFVAPQEDDDDVGGRVCGSNAAGGTPWLAVDDRRRERSDRARSTVTCQSSGEHDDAALDGEARAHDRACGAGSRR